jgi:hypothetical protein
LVACQPIIQSGSTRFLCRSPSLFSWIIHIIFTLLLVMSPQKIPLSLSTSTTVRFQIKDSWALFKLNLYSFTTIQ